MTTLVTGGRGFVGRYLVDLLAESGEQVVSYNRDYAVSHCDGVHMVMGELFDLPRLLSTLREYGVDRIVHTAAQSHPEVSIEVPLTTVAANIDGTVAVLEAARTAGVRRIVNFSSECALGNLDPTAAVTEDATPTPTTPYGVTKVTGEMLGRVYTALYGMDVVSLRVTEVYGPGLWMPSFLGDLLRAAVTGTPYRLEHGVEQGFNFVHVRDVARAALLAVTAAAVKQPVYNISGGEQLTAGQAAEVVRQVVPGADINLGPGPMPNWDRQGPYDLSAAERDLGYRPEWSFERGVVDLVEFLRTQPAAPGPLRGPA